MSGKKVISIKISTNIKEKFDKYLSLNKDTYVTKTNLFRSMVNNIELLTTVDPFTIHPDLVEMVEELKKRNTLIDDLKSENEQLKKDIDLIQNNEIISSSNNEQDILTEIKESISIIETLVATEYRRNEDYNLKQDKILEIDKYEPYIALKNIINKKGHKSNSKKEQKENDVITNQKKRAMKELL